MNAPAPSEAEGQERFGDLHRMPQGEELKISTTHWAMPFLAGFLLLVALLVSEFPGEGLELYFAAIPAMGALVALLFREEVILNRRLRTAAVRWHLLFRRDRTTPVAEQAMLKITCRTERPIDLTGQGTRKREFFDVRLVSFGAVADDDEGFLLLAADKHPQARRLAEQTARFLRLGIADFSSGKALVRDAKAVNESLRDRLARYGRVPVMPARPAKCRIRERVAGDWVEFRLPKVDRGLFCGTAGFAFVAQFLLGLGIAYKLEMLRGPDRLPDAGFFALLGFGGLLILSAAGYALFVLSFQERVRVGREGLALLTSSIYTRRKRTIPSEKLEELFMGVATDSWLNVGREAVVARSDDLSLEFGARLNDDERRWLRDVIFYLVTAPEGSK